MSFPFLEIPVCSDCANNVSMNVPEVQCPAAKSVNFVVTKSCPSSWCDLYMRFTCLPCVAVDKYSNAINVDSAEVSQMTNGSDTLHRAFQRQAVVFSRFLSMLPMEEL